MKDQLESIAVFLVILATVVIPLCLMMVIVPLGIYGGARCLEIGYPTSYLYPFEIKCGIIVEQTQYVCSLRECTPR